MLIENQRGDLGWNRISDPFEIGSRLARGRHD